MNAMPNPTNDKILAAAEILWNYMLLGHVLKPVDIIFVLGSRDGRVAKWAAELYKRGISKRILISGGLAHQNDILAVKWKKTEAEQFAKIIIEHGVPSSCIILETKATNTGENILRGHELLAKQNIKPKSILIVQKPYMERRSYAAFMKQWPGLKNEVIVSSPPLTFAKYFNQNQPFELVANIMVGDMQRIIEYPARGYQIAQKVPPNVLKAYNFLIKNKYDKHLLQH